MKKALFILLILLVGCSLKIGGSPIKKVEEYFNKYQMLDTEVLRDLDYVLKNETAIDNEEKEKYLEFMKNHYSDLKYEIKDEKIDGNKAIVEVEITVRDYSKAVKKVEDMKQNSELKSFSKYRLKELKNITDTAIYTLNISLTKLSDDWVIDQLNNEDLNKINGLYIG